jgi:signal transduction histidine kinase
MSLRGPAGEPRWRSNAHAEAQAAGRLRQRADAPPFRGGTAVAASEVLNAAAERVRCLWNDRDVGELLRPADLDVELAVIMAGIEAELAGTAASFEADDADRVVRRRLLMLLQTEVHTIFAEASAPPSGEQMLPLLRAIDAARRALDSEWDDDPQALLSSPDGLALVGEVAHDLRSPLTAVLFLADNLRRGYSGELNEVQSRQIGIIYSAALGLVEVASDLVDLSRDQHVVAHGTPQPFSLLEQLESVRRMVQPIAEEKGLAVTVDADRPDQRAGHATAINRALLNLATNALKFTDVGGVTIRATAVDANHVCFSVEDTGRGIAEEALQRLYQPFRRRPNCGQAFSGTGLGLLIVRRLVESLGSELVVETQPGVGTRFHFTLRTPPATRY